MQTVAENSDIRSLRANKVQWRVICGFHAVGQQHSENANLSLEGINDPECCFFFFFSQFILYLRISCLLRISSYYTSSYCSLREAELHKEKQQSSGICCIQKKKNITIYYDGSNGFNSFIFPHSCHNAIVSHFISHSFPI